MLFQGHKIFEYGHNKPEISMKFQYSVFVFFPSLPCIKLCKWPVLFDLNSERQITPSAVQASCWVCTEISTLDNDCSQAVSRWA